MTAGAQRLRSAVDEASARLAAAGVPSPRTDAVALAADVLGVGAGEVHHAMILGRDLDGPQSQRYAELVGLRADRIPLQHLTGRAAFRGIELTVGPGTFVPRPETEGIVDLVLAELRGHREVAQPAAQQAPDAASHATSVGELAAIDREVAQPAAQWAPDAASHATSVGEAAGELAGAVVVDLCTGSGAIALAIASEAPDAQVVAVELSEIAVRTARHNAARIAPGVVVAHADATADPATIPELAALVGRVDVVVSNPPYIPTGAIPLDPEVAEHDPPMALYGGSVDGLAIPLRVAARAARLLRPGGLLLMEHADVQGDSLPEALRATGDWEQVRDHRDLTGRPRHTSARSRTATAARLEP